MIHKYPYICMWPFCPLISLYQCMLITHYTYTFLIVLSIVVVLVSQNWAFTLHVFLKCFCLFYAVPQLGPICGRLFVFVQKGKRFITSGELNFFAFFFSVPYSRKQLRVSVDEGREIMRICTPQTCLHARKKGINSLYLSIIYAFIIYLTESFVAI